MIKFKFFCLWQYSHKNPYDYSNQSKLPKYLKKNGSLGKSHIVNGGIDLFNKYIISQLQLKDIDQKNLVEYIVEFNEQNKENEQEAMCPVQILF